VICEYDVCCVCDDEMFFFMIGRFVKTIEKIEMLFLDLVEYIYQAKRRTKRMTMTKTASMSPAVRAAALKREKKAAAVLARAAGKAAVAEKRAAFEAAWLEGVRNGREEIEKKVQVARKALGLGKNDPNPSGVFEMKEKWEFEMMSALRKKLLGQ
jgi:hypothetical protein